MSKTFFQRLHIQYLLLTILFILIAVYYGYFELMSVAPTGTHVWRQTDSASFAWTYWQNGLTFFKPQIMNRSVGQGIAVSEFPILQYLIAIAYSIFGHHWFISKLFYVIVYFSGLYALFYMVANIVKDIFWSFFIALLFFAAPGMVFYGCTCIPDVAAFSFALMGMAFLIAHRKKGKTVLLCIATTAFCLCGLLKLTYALPFFVLTGVVFIFSFLKDKPLKNLMEKKYILVFFVICICLLGWFFLMKYYNLKSNNAYFLTGINPIWSVTENAETKSYIYHRFTTEWATRFFHFSTHLLIGLSIIFILFFVKKANKFLLAFTILLFIGLLFYFFLWYIQFYVHDYYTIMFYFFYVVLLINIFIILEKVQNPPWVSFLLKSLSIVLLLFNIHHTKKDILTRHEEFNSYPNDVLLSETAFRQHIREIGILPKDYIIAIPDGSPQISLCYLGNAGFTEFAEGKYDLDKIIQKKKQGAKFLIITDQEAYKALILQLGNPWSAYKTALIYKL